MPQCCVSIYTIAIYKVTVNVAYVIFKKVVRCQNILYGFTYVTLHNVKADKPVTELYLFGKFKCEGWSDPH